MQFRLSRFSLGISILGLILLTGCPSGQKVSSESVANHFRDQELQLVVPKSLNLTNNWEVMIQEWTSQTGASARFVDYDASTANLRSAIPTASSGGNIVLIPANRLCEIDQTLTPLTPKEGQAQGPIDVRDVFRGIRERALSRERQMIACPISMPILVCYYRSDLLSSANLSPPETWDEYHRLVENVNSWAPGLVAVEPLDSKFRATMFFARSLAYCKHPENYSVWFDTNSGQPTLNSPGFEKALEVAEQTWRKLTPETITYSPADCRRLILTGKAALALSFEPSEAELVPHLPDNSGNTIPRRDDVKIGICRLPGTRRVYNRNSKKWDAMPSKTVHAPALCGFAGLVAGVVLPKQQSEESAAINLLSTLYSASVFDRAFATLPKSPCREFQQGQCAVWYAPELSADEASHYSDVTAQALQDTQLVFELPVVGAEDFRVAASNALEPMLRGESNVQQTLSQMQQSFEKIVERLGADTIKNSYRRGLGLSPALKK